jgi:hypothetical protein
MQNTILYVTRFGQKSSWLSLLLLLSACSLNPRPTVLETTVGPAPAQASRPANQGYLVVYSAWSSFVDQGYMAHHSRYNLASQDGTMTKEVLNYRDRFDEGPIRLPLPPGSYQLTARAAHYGKVVVPVMIKEHQTTFVYLDGSSHPEIPLTQTTNLVKLPNGQIVGWSASAGAITAD